MKNNDKCSKCSRKSAYYLPYLGKSLCKTCFIKLQEQRISKTIRNNQLIADKDKIAVALSGGKDSAVVLDFLKRYTRYKKDIKIKAFYVDRGDYFSVKSAEMCRKICKKEQVDLEIISLRSLFDFSMTDIVNVSKKLGVNRCSVCGVLRRRALDLVAREQGFTKLATGHNLTDEAQSFLMNFSRADLKGFSALGAISLPKRKGFVQRIKILRSIPEDEVKAYADFIKLKYSPELCKCREGSFRFNFMNYLEDMKKTRPGIEFSIVKIGDQISELVRKQRKGNISKCKVCGELTSQDICQVCKYISVKNNLH